MVAPRQRHSLQHQRLVELERREKLFGEAQHIARIANWDWDPASGNVTWSDEMFRINRLDPEVFRPTTENFFDRVHPDDIAHVHDAVAQCFSGNGHEPVTYDYRFVLDLGEVRWLRSRAVAWRDEAWSPVRLSGSSQDVTESKENEKTLAVLCATAGAANEAHRLQDVLLSACTIIRLYVEWPVVVISAPKHPVVRTCSTSTSTGSR